MIFLKSCGIDVFVQSYIILFAASEMIKLFFLEFRLVDIVLLCEFGWKLVAIISMSLPQILLSYISPFPHYELIIHSVNLLINCYLFFTRNGYP
jgi:hypothetical protein